ncbi:MAG: sulfite oxidase-like oxidoreductase [Gemmatimonadota bacterium]|jgi:DMSO/TMAO reductase YedYZ molybdopterin-dependent catalytic subunit|nr:sulfite oxidase-like oxidoreductase [Gemmatimonadota bacterium]
MPFFRSRASQTPASTERLPPGQVLTEKWPVLHYGAVPYVKREGWELRIWGEVEEELRIGWDELVEVGSEERFNDIHCVTRWSRFDNRWTGIPVQRLMERVRLKPSATHVMLHAQGGWTTNLALADWDRPANLLATHHDGEPLSEEHGAPLRTVVPHLYFWKSAKWLKGLEFLPRDRAGFWEQNGYHMRGDPWREQRYGGFGWG